MALQHSNLRRGTIIPADNFLILQPVFLSNVTDTGIQTGLKEETLPFGKLIARGKNCCKFKVGAYLLLSPMGGYTYRILDMDYIIAKEIDIVAEAQFLEENKQKDRKKKKVQGASHV